MLVKRPQGPTVAYRYSLVTLYSTTTPSVTFSSVAGTIFCLGDYIRYGSTIVFLI